MLLSKAQASAAYTVLQTMNGLAGTTHLRFLASHNRVVHFKDYLTGPDFIQVWVGDYVGNPTGEGWEHYQSYTDFAISYDLV